MHYDEAKRQLIEYFQALHEKNWDECIVCFFNQGEVGKIKPEGKHFLLTNSQPDIYDEIVVSKDNAKYYAALFKKYEPAIVVFAGSENIRSSLRSGHRNGISIAYEALEFMQNELREDLRKLGIKIDMEFNGAPENSDIVNFIGEAARAAFLKAAEDEEFHQAFEEGLKNARKASRIQKTKVINQLDQAGLEPEKAVGLAEGLIRKFSNNEEHTPDQVVKFIKRGLGKKANSSLGDLAKVAAIVI